MPTNGTVNGAAAEIGSFLRDTRESQEKSLDEAARVTRIGKNYLLAIEAGMFEKLPNPAYVKGFLRIYAGYLGLSDDAIVARYEQLLASPPPRPSPLPSGEAAAAGRSRAPAPGLWIVSAILLCLIILSTLILGRREPGGKQLPIVAPIAQPTTMAPQPSQARHSSAKAGNPAPAPVDRPPASIPFPPPGDTATRGIILKLKVNQDSWLNVTIDDSLSQSYDLKPGDLIEWKGGRNFTLDISNAGGVEAELNGKSLPPFGESGKSAHIVLGESGRQN